MFEDLGKFLKFKRLLEKTMFWTHVDWNKTNIQPPVWPYFFGLLRLSSDTCPFGGNFVTVLPSWFFLDPCLQVKSLSDSPSFGPPPPLQLLNTGFSTQQSLNKYLLITFPFLFTTRPITLFQISKPLHKLKLNQAARIYKGFVHFPNSIGKRLQWSS